MHVRSISRQAPAQAVNIQIFLDIILQAINVLEAVERFLGIRFVDSITKGNNGTA